MLVARVGSIIAHPETPIPTGMVFTGSTARLVDGLPVARVTDKAMCKRHPGKPRLIITGSGTALCDGLPVAYVGSVLDCGAVIITGSLSSEVGV